MVHLIKSKSWKWAALCMAMLIALMALSGCSLFSGEEEEPLAEDVLSEEPADNTTGFRQTVLYYQADSGHMVPVMKLLPWEEGIGRAALEQLVDTEANRLSAAQMGLKNVAPQGVAFSLSISDEAVGTVDIQNLPELADAEAERNLLTAIVNTLTEFPTIDSVQFRFDGARRETLDHGTSVSGVVARQPLNVEPLPVSAVEGEYNYRLTLYYPNMPASIYVPVTRMTISEASLAEAMAELVRGPADDTLRNCFPEGTTVLAATIIDGVALVNLSQEFAALKDTPDFEAAAIDSMKLTAKEFGALNGLHIQVEGQEYETEADTQETMAMPGYVNEYR